MVDVGAARQSEPVSRRGMDAAANRSGSLIDVRPADSAAVDDYEAFCRGAFHAPAQSPLWVRSWMTATGADGIVVTVRRDGRAIMAFALEVAREGPFRIARFMGGGHANGNFVAVARDVALPLSTDDGAALVAAIRSARPDIDLVFLQRQNPDIGGLKNPLSMLPGMQSPNVSLAVDLVGGFDEVLSRSGGKRKRKKYRLQLRKFEEAGGYRLIEAGSPEEVERLLNDFFVMKAARFRKKGIPNVFASQEVQAFFRALFGGALSQKPLPFALEAVEVAGEIRAVNGLSLTESSVICEFGGIRDDDAYKWSPGYFLDYTNIEEACADGKVIYDFSVGDEEYKRSWCDIETWQFDTLLPVSAKGRLLLAYHVARSRAVRFVKSNEAIWSFVKRMRKDVAATKPADDE